MWFTRTVDGFRGWLQVEQSNGSLRTGLAAGDFVATIVNPADGATSILVVAQSTKAGLYRFDVPSAFLVTNGVGEYGAVVEIDTFAGPSGPPHVRRTFSAVLKVSLEDFDSLAVTAAAILADTDAINVRLPADPADESNQLAAHAVTQAAVAAVQADVTQVLGLAGRNKKVTVLTKNAALLPLTQRVRVYDTKANLDTDDGSTGLILQHDIETTYTTNSMDDFESTDP